MQAGSYYFPYEQNEMNYLSEKDPKLGRFIEKYGHLKRKINSDIFFSLVEMIIAQQISAKAAETVFARLKTQYPDLSPKKIVESSDETLRACGISMRKVSYIKSAADFFLTNSETYASMQKMNNDELIRLLTQIKGVGIWTVEMLLIFSFGRKDILSYNDYGIRKGLMILHELSELTKEQFEIFRDRYSPHGSIASFYLWEIAGC